MKIISFGDIHMATGQIARLSRELSNADMALLSGDLTNFGGKQEAAQVLSAVSAACSTVFAVPGNLDRAEAVKFLEAEQVSLHGRGRRWKAISLFGCGGSNITPFRTPLELGEEGIERLLREGYENVARQEPLLMVCHTPPYDTMVDRLRDGRHVGSPVVRRLVEEMQPAVCVSGHVHEAAGLDRLGSTTLVNAGPLREGGYIVIESTRADQFSVELRSL